MRYFKNNSYSKIQLLSIVSVMGGISFILMFISLPFPLFPSFLKLDISEVPALLVSFIFGPIYGVCVVLVKNIIHLLFTSTAGIGEFANFIIGSTLVLISGIIYKKMSTKLALAISLCFGTIFMTIVAALMNYYILIPMYNFILPVEAILNMCRSINPDVESLSDVIIFFIVPFNLIKAFFISVLTYILCIRLKVSPRIER